MSTNIHPTDPNPSDLNRPVTTAAGAADEHEASFAETALKLGGKSEDEARRTGAIDKADDQVEQLFQPQYQTVNSPAHRAVWDRGLPVELFQSTPSQTPADVQKVMDDSVAVVRRHREARTLLNEEHKIRDEVLEQLGSAGYWGLLVDREYGGSGARFRDFAPFLTRMAMNDPTIAGLASVHGCIGAVDPVRTFGSPEQKQRFLPRLASGQSLSAFALTEPGAGSDLTALRTRAVLDGDDYVVNGEKLFITNVVPGRTIGLVCLIDDKPAVLVADLPAAENDQFQLKKYGLYALKHTYNRGIVFRDFRVPAANLLEPIRGNGLTIAYHGLNLGRVSLCANAAGTMRLMMASMIPWAKFRSTYGEPIASRELVERRLGRLAGLIVACDALVAWCSQLIDAGYRGEMECIVAKIFGSEAQKEAAIEFYMKTHGGRSFLHGHMFGDNVHEYLAPCIYEGEGEMLGMAFFKSLVKAHGVQYFESIGKALQAAGIRKPNPLNPAHMWALKGAMAPYARWLMSQYIRGGSSPTLPPMPDRLRKHAQFAAEQLQASPLEISGVMRKHQLKLADRQCRMSELSARIQKLIVMLCTSLYAGRQNDELVRSAADVICRDLRRELTGERPSDRDQRATVKLGEAILDGGFRSLAGIEPDEILMRYES
ncbi:MAG: acyl-CoA/acyl-ACP dehydrogenase [Planctomycetales bacterium]|nr:acyl-CoA/acyl-ACP dehydrogenase [Planctomycetales bacterium]